MIFEKPLLVAHHVQSQFYQNRPEVTSNIIDLAKSFINAQASVQATVYVDAMDLMTSEEAGLHPEFRKLGISGDHYHTELAMDYVPSIKKYREVVLVGFNTCTCILNSALDIRQNATEVNLYIPKNSIANSHDGTFRRGITSDKAVKQMADAGCIILEDGQATKAVEGMKFPVAAI